MSLERTFPFYQQTYFWYLSIFRSIFFCALILILSQFLLLGTGNPGLTSSAIIGIFLGGWFAFSRFRLRAIILLLTMILLSYWIFFAALGQIPFRDNAQILGVANWKNHLELCLLTFSLAFTSTVFFWRFRSVINFEVILAALAVVGFMAPHRNYRFDMLQVLSQWAWKLNLSHLELIVLIGACAVVFIFIYVLLATLPKRPFPDWKRPIVVVHPSPFHALSNALVTCLGVLALMLITFSTYNYHRSSVTSNGVSQETGPGMSPLDFHSSLGSSSQPAALARLEGDYVNNPFSPMIYFREAALSEYDGKEFIVSKTSLDHDVSFTKPGEFYKSDGNPDHLEREPLTQSIYLLSKHKLAFAIDYPISLVKLSLPKKSRKFKGAYRAYSMAPAFDLNKLSQEDVGNQKWPQNVKEHYLKTSSNSRYAEIAKEITSGSSKPVEKALDIVAFLNANAIYTLTPNHDIKDGEDPAAAFLFGDLRGYCVHFAHATVYMLRALGIPARIATGYLSDLSQARDGHILLRMNDRHAWAEVYLSSYGWVPFDTQPDQVENHGETPVDVNLLEELMDLLEPGEEILPDDTLEGEIIGERDEVLSGTLKQGFIFTFFGLFVVAILLKFLLWFFWLLPSKGPKQVRNAYIALCSRLSDLGYSRKFGETREEFRKRIDQLIGEDVLRITPLLNQANYSKVFSEKFSWNMNQDLINLRNLPRLKRFKSIFSPASLVKFLRGKKW